MSSRAEDVEVSVPPWVVGAVGMAQHWLRNPERMTDAGFEQVCRELYTISRALAYLAAAGLVEQRSGQA